jgi:hypothetical protein
MGLSHALQLDADGQHQWTDIDQFCSYRSNILMLW